MAFLGSAPGGSRAAAFGSSLGEGLGKGLTALAEAKLQKLQTEHSEKQFLKEGYGSREAKLFSRIQHDPSFKNNPELIKLLGQYPPSQDIDEGENQNQVQEPNYLENFQHPEQQQQEQIKRQNFEQIAQSLKNPMDFAQARIGQIPQQFQQKQIQSQQQMQQPQRQLMGEQQPQIQTRKKEKPQFVKRLTPSEQLNQQKHLEGISKEKNDLINNYESAAQMADSVVEKVDAIKQLSQRSDFKTGYDYYISKNYIGGLPRSNQLVDKLIADLTPALATANSSSGNRLTDAQRELAANSIPNPYEMTKEGMKDAADALGNIYKIPREYAKTANDTFKKNPNVPASDLQRLINEQAQPKIDKLYKSIVPEELKLNKESSGASGIPGENILKAGARGVARAGESFAGTPGDIVDFVSGIVGKVSPEVSNVLQQIPLPNSSQVREAAKKTVGQVAPGLYEEPSGILESAGDKFGSLLGSVLFPIGGPAKAVAALGVKPTLIKGLKLAGLGTLAGYAGKAVGGETGEKVATIGTILLSNIGGPRAIRAYAESLPAKQGNEIFKAMKEPSRIHEFIKNVVPTGKVRSDVTKTLFGLGAYGLLGLKGLGKAGAAGIGAGYAEKALRALNQSPELRGYFYQAISSAAKDNKVALIKAIGKVDETIKKQKLDY